MSDLPPHPDRPPLTRRLTPQEISDLHDEWDDRKWLKANYLEIPSTPRKPVVILTPSREIATYWRYYYGYYHGDWVDGSVCRDIAREADLRPSMTSDRWELVLIKGWQETPLAYSSVLSTRFPDWLGLCITLTTKVLNWSRGPKSGSRFGRGCAIITVQELTTHRLVTTDMAWLSHSSLRTSPHGMSDRLRSSLLLHMIDDTGAIYQD